LPDRGIYHPSGCGQTQHVVVIRNVWFSGFQVKPVVEAGIGKSHFPPYATHALVVWFLAVRKNCHLVGVYWYRPYG
jgi:hypothetical protein